MTEQDLKIAWQQQATEAVAMSPLQLHASAEAFARLIRKRNRIEYVAGAFAIVAFAFYFWLFDGALLRAGSALLILGMLFVLHQLHRRGASPRPAPDDLGAPCLAFHRAALVRQRDALRSAWAWYVLPLVPGMMIFIWGVATELAGGRASGRWVAILVAAVFVAVALLNRWAASRLQREIDQLE